MVAARYLGLTALTLAVGAFAYYAPRVLEHIRQTYRPLDSRDKERARIFVRQAP